MKNLLTTAAALIFIASAPVLNAQTVLNGDFSSPDVGTTYNSSVPTDFTGEAGFSGGVISSSEYSSLPYSQPQYLYVNVPQPSGSGAPGGIDGIYQDLGALKPLTAYTVTVAESAGSAGGSGATYGAGGLGSTFELDLYNGTDNSTTPVATTDTVLGAAYMMTGAFTDETVTFDTGAVVKGDLTFGLSAFDVSEQNNGQDFFANVRLASTPLGGLPATPEPSACALIIAGLGVLVLVARLRRAA